MHRQAWDHRTQCSRFLNLSQEEATTKISQTFNVLAAFILFPSACVASSIGVWVFLKKMLFKLNSFTSDFPHTGLRRSLEISFSHIRGLDTGRVKQWHAWSWVCMDRHSLSWRAAHMCGVESAQSRHSLSWWASHNSMTCFFWLFLSLISWLAGFLRQGLSL